MTLGAKAHELIHFGPLVRVGINHHPAAAKALIKEHQALWGSPPPSRIVTFLVDTGAPQTLVSQEILDDLKLTPTSSVISIKTAYGVLTECPTYLVEMCLKLDNGDATLTTKVVGLRRGGLLPHARYQGILGRTLLQKARFVYDGAAGTFDITLVKP